jgi:hypothetical protein
MKKFSKKNIKKNKVSKKRQNKIQKGGVFDDEHIADNIKTLDEIMRTTKDNQGNLLQIYDKPAHSAYKKLSLYIHPDKQTDRSKENIDKYTRLFQVIGDFDEFVERSFPPETTWNEVIHNIKYSNEGPSSSFKNTPSSKPQATTQRQSKRNFTKEETLNELLKENERIKRRMEQTEKELYEKEVTNLGFNIKEEISQIIEKSIQTINTENKQNDIPIYTSIDKAELMSISQENINKMKESIKLVSKDNNLIKIREILQRNTIDIKDINTKIEPISEELIKYNKILKKIGNYKTIIDTIKANILILNDLDKLLIICKNKKLDAYPRTSIELLKTQIEKSKKELTNNLHSIGHYGYIYPSKERYKYFRVSNKIIDKELLIDDRYLKEYISNLNNNEQILNYRWLNTEFKTYIDNYTYLLAIKQIYEDIKKDLEKTENIYLSIIKNKQKDIIQSKEEISNNNIEINKLSKNNNKDIKRNELLILRNQELNIQIKIYEKDIESLNTLITNLSI